MVLDITVGQIEISLLLKIQGKQHHILYLMILYKHNMMGGRVHA
jgi:hypothetical protein